VIVGTVDGILSQDAAQPINRIDNAPSNNIVLLRVIKVNLYERKLLNRSYSHNKTDMIIIIVFQYRVAVLTCESLLIRFNQYTLPRITQVQRHR